MFLQAGFGLHRDRLNTHRVIITLQAGNGERPVSQRLAGKRVATVLLTMQAASSLMASGKLDSALKPSSGVC